jgi:hypothetical protein
MLTIVDSCLSIFAVTGIGAIEVSRSKSLGRIIIKSA